MNIKAEPFDWSQWAGTSQPTQAVADLSSSNPETAPKKKGRKKIVDKPIKSVKKEVLKQELITEVFKERKKRDRFNGLSEEQVLQRTLPDHLAPDLDIVIIGINPGLTAAYVGHHYAGPGNHFWKCLFLSGLIPEQMNAMDDFKLIQFGIGFTNIVDRTSRGSADLTRQEIKDGGENLKQKIQKYKPKIAVFNGKGIYEVFSGQKKICLGKQADHFPECPDTQMFVMPSSSARFTQLPRAIDKVPFYMALKKFRDFLRGNEPTLDDSEVCFPDLDLKVVPRADRIKTEPDAALDVNNETSPKKAPPKRKSTGKIKVEVGREQEGLEDNTGTSPKKAPRKRKSTGKNSAVQSAGQQDDTVPVIKQERVHDDMDYGRSSTSQHSVQLPYIKPDPDSPYQGGYYENANAGIVYNRNEPIDLSMPSTRSDTNPSSIVSPSGSLANYESLEALLSSPNASLVKQEDLSELASFGLNPQNLTSTHMQQYLARQYAMSSLLYQTHTPRANGAHSQEYLHPYWSQYYQYSQNK